jgi:RNA polymerase sigma-70 factor (ECF subfamily)
MTWRLAIDRCRAAHRRQQVELAANDAGGATTAETVEAVEAVETREREELLWKAIDTLPHKLRMVLVLASIEGHEVKDVASLLGIPKGTVKSRLFAARQRLKEQLQWPLIDSAIR